MEPTGGKGSDVDSKMDCKVRAREIRLQKNSEGFVRLMDSVRHWRFIVFALAAIAEECQIIAC